MSGPSKDPETDNTRGSVGAGVGGDHDHDTGPDRSENGEAEQGDGEGTTEAATHPRPPDTSALGLFRRRAE